MSNNTKYFIIAALAAIAAYYAWKYYQKQKVESPKKTE